MFIFYKYLSLFAFIALYACQKKVDISGQTNKIKSKTEVETSTSNEKAAEITQDELKLTPEAKSEISTILISTPCQISAEKIQIESGQANILHLVIPEGASKAIIDDQDVLASKGILQVLPFETKEYNASYVLNDENFACKITVTVKEPTYIPNDIKCDLPIQGDTIWNAVPDWAKFLSQKIDKNAKWISPLEAEILPNSKTHSCPSIPQNERLIFVSNFEIKTTGSYYIEVLDDNEGAARLWKDKDPKQNKLLLKINAFSSETLTLEAGKYALVIDALDGGGASAISVSIMNAEKTNVIKSSQKDGTWCAWRTKKEIQGELLDQFILHNARRYECFTK